jgi:TolB-like protein/DNA-binding winged helix-turn-helix (wHTH) protein/tetratricopeptide (TPR) repeat protein
MEHEVRFADYRFELATGRLWHGPNEVRLTPKASAVLKELVAHAGQLVSKETLFASVWPDTAVGDDALTTCVQEVRRALNDDPKQPRFIETRHRRGYRFLATLLPASPPGTADFPAGTPVISSIGVLPFVDMSPARDQGHLCEGIADELITVLSQVAGLRVAARMASFHLRQTGGDVRQIARHLHITTLLDGSVRKINERLRITVDLVDVASGYQHWSERFDRTVADVFAMQDEIAEHVASRVKRGLLSGDERQRLVRPQTTAAAYELYLRGRHHLVDMTRAGLARSAELFQDAIDLDPHYGPAFAGLATVHATLYEWFGARPENLAGAEHASRRAIEVAPDLAESHMARGCALALSRRYADAAREFEDAIARNPQLFDSYYYFARTAFASGDIARSAELFRRAGEVRAEDYQSPILMAQSLQMLGRAEEGHAAAQEGVRRAERMLGLNPGDVRALSTGSIALFAIGQPVRAFEWSQRALELSPDDTSALVNAACVRIRAGQKEQALALLERVFGEGRGKRDWVEHDPDYVSLRGDPRFERMLARLK